MANILNSITPSKGGDIIKSVYFRKELGLNFSFGTVIVERLVDLYLLGLLSIFGYFLIGTTWCLTLGFVIIFSIKIFLLIGIITSKKKIDSSNKYLKKIVQLLNDINRVIRLWSEKPIYVFQTFFASALIWILTCFSIGVLSYSINSNVSPLYIVAILPAAVLAGLIPTSISGIGTRDAAFIFFLSKHYSTDESILISIGYTVLAYWIINIIFLPFVFLEIKKVLKKGTKIF